MKKTGIVITHFLFAASFGFLALSIANHFNSSMAFIDHSLTKEVLAAFLAVTYIFTVVTLFMALLEGKTVLSFIRALNLIVIIVLAAALISDALNPKAILFSSMWVKRLLFAFEILGALNYGIIIYGNHE